MTDTMINAGNSFTPKLKYIDGEYPESVEVKINKIK